MASQTKTKRYKGNSANRTMAKSCLNMPWLSSGLLALQHPMKLECGMKSITIYGSLINQLQKFTDHYLGQALITSRDVPIEKIGTNTGFKLSFISPSIKELASS
jgi:hypothetical protein